MLLTLRLPTPCAQYSVHVRNYTGQQRTVVVADWSVERL
jgi:hypothetical protein